MHDFQNLNNSSGLTELNSNRSHDGDHLINSIETSSPSNINSTNPVDHARAYCAELKTASIDEYPASTSSDNSSDTNESISFVNNTPNGNFYYSNQYFNTNNEDVNANQNSACTNLLNYGLPMPQYFQNISNNHHLNYYSPIFPTNSYTIVNNSNNNLSGFNNFIPNFKNEQNQEPQHEQENKKDEEQFNHFSKVSENQDEQYQEEADETSANSSYSSTQKNPIKKGRVKKEELEPKSNNNQSYLMQPPDSELIAAATRNVRTKRRTRTKFDQHQLDALEATFQRTHYPDVHVVDRLATLLKLTPEKISIWFQNRRAKFKKSKKNPITDQTIEEEKELNMSQLSENNEVALESIGKRTSESYPFKERDLNEMKNNKQQFSKIQETKQQTCENTHVSKAIFNPVNLPDVNQAMFTRPFQLHYQSNSINQVNQNVSYQNEENMKLPITPEENLYSTSTPAPKDSVELNNSTNDEQSSASKESSSNSSSASSPNTSASCSSSYNAKNKQLNQEELNSTAAYLQTPNLFFNNQYQPSSTSFYTHPLQYANLASIPQIFQPYIDYNLQDSNISTNPIGMQNFYNNYSNYIPHISVNEQGMPYNPN